MCGFCGTLYFDQRPADPQILTRMLDTLQHRGPDDAGIWHNHAIGLASRRLAILDLSAAGHMPMHSADGRLSVAYNGEIYNYPQLRTQLESAKIGLRSHSDTESLLYLYQLYGVEFLQALRGMFALALWDEASQTLTLARDRLGKKPLYYAWQANRLLFASEIKAILAHPQVPRQVDTRWLPHFLAYGYVPTPHTLFSGIQALPPAHYLQLSLANPNPQIQAYWSAPTPPEPYENRSVAEWKHALKEQLRTAVQLRMLSDVPLGAFLSGGIDSSLVVALMREFSSQPVKTFAIGFADSASFNEAPYAKQVAQILGTEHHELLVQPQAVELLPKLVWHLDQPFADSSCIPTFLVSEFARSAVTVALTGDGGDELFAGYERFYAARLAERYQQVPTFLRNLLTQGLASLPQGTDYRNFSRRALRFAQQASLPLSERYLGWVGVMLAEQAATWTATDPREIYRHYQSYFRLPTQPDPLPALLDVNLRTYLPEDLLVKVDRMSMAASLEARSPFLDHVLVEFANTLPLELKLRGKVGKWILREWVSDYLPPALFQRPKHGFGVPIGQWFRSSLRDYLCEHLLSADAHYRAYLQSSSVTAMVEQHLSGQADHAHRLWAVLSFEIWLRLFIQSSGSGTEG
ncbi:MAG TPA: asparagine synthase (glutamine-hydrolyzing) [Anaerolineales bacterium]|nr:asparagine synthase (glutamine-hydrolyzing) [Anaerolineales bacterium]